METTTTRIHQGEFLVSGHDADGGVLSTTGGGLDAVIMSGRTALECAEGWTLGGERLVPGTTLSLFYDREVALVNNPNDSRCAVMFADGAEFIVVPACDDDIVEFYFGNGQYDQDCAITVGYYLDLISDSSHDDYRLVVAEHAYTSQDTLEVLALDSVDYVRQAALSNPTLSAYDKVRLARKAADGNRLDVVKDIIVALDHDFVWSQETYTNRLKTWAERA